MWKLKKLLKKQSTSSPKLKLGPAGRLSGKVKGLKVDGEFLYEVSKQVEKKLGIQLVTVLVSTDLVIISFLPNYKKKE